MAGSARDSDSDSDSDVVQNLLCTTSLVVASPLYFGICPVGVRKG